MESPSTPHYARTARTRIREVLHSAEAIAIIFSIMIVAGYGEMLSGLVLGRNRSRAGNKGLFVPYVPDLYTPIESPYLQTGRSFILADVAKGATTCRMDITDARKMVVGDDLIIDDTTTQAENLGAITAIDVSSKRYAQITFTNPVTAAAGFLMARNANVYPNTGWCTNLAANVAATATSCTVANSRIDELADLGITLKRGDTIVMVDSNSDAENLGAVTSITRGASNTTIGFTTAVVGAFGTAQSAMIYILRDNISYASCILTRTREGGENGLPDIENIIAPAVFKNAVLYTASLGNLDTNAKSDLGAGQINGFTYI